MTLKPYQQEVVERMKNMRRAILGLPPSASQLPPPRVTSKDGQPKPIRRNPNGK